MSKVSISKCASYDEQQLDVSLRQALSPIGGMKAFVRPGQKVLLKINALMECDPGSAIVTHPQFTKAVAKLVINAGGIPFIGDNPGNAGADSVKVIESIGYKKIADELGIKIANLQKDGAATFLPKIGDRRAAIHISKTLLEADVVINLPKLKTHMLMLYTGAVKNMFGAVPGFNKSKLHFLLPGPKEFAKTIVEIYSITKPSLNIMDAVISMEGNGPAGGTPRKTGLILASGDGVALDAVAASAIGFNEGDILTTSVAGRHKIGESSLRRIQISGSRLEDIRIKDFKKPASAHGLMKAIPGFIYSLARPLLNMVKILPIIDAEKCRACLACVKNCPAKCITVKKGEAYAIDHKMCIMCFCCHELCPYDAIALKKSFLARMFIR